MKKKQKKKKEKEKEKKHQVFQMSFSRSPVLSHVFGF